MVQHSHQANQHRTTSYNDTTGTTTPSAAYSQDQSIPAPTEQIRRSEHSHHQLDSNDMVIDAYLSTILVALDPSLAQYLCPNGTLLVRLQTPIATNSVNRQSKASSLTLGDSNDTSSPTEISNTIQSRLLTSVRMPTLEVGSGVIYNSLENVNQDSVEQHAPSVTTRSLSDGQPLASQSAQAHPRDICTPAPNSATTTPIAYFSIFYSKVTKLIVQSQRHRASGRVIVTNVETNNVTESNRHEIEEQPRQLSAMEEEFFLEATRQRRIARYDSERAARQEHVMSIVAQVKERAAIKITRMSRRVQLLSIELPLARPMTTLPAATRHDSVVLTGKLSGSIGKYPVVDSHTNRITFSPPHLSPSPLRLSRSHGLLIAQAEIGVPRARVETVAISQASLPKTRITVQAGMAQRRTGIGVPGTIAPEACWTISRAGEPHYRRNRGARALRTSGKAISPATTAPRPAQTNSLIAHHNHNNIRSDNRTRSTGRTSLHHY